MAAEQYAQQRGQAQAQTRGGHAAGQAKINTTKVKAGIFSLTLLTLSVTGISPSLSAIAEAFPEGGTTMAQMLTSIPSLMGIFASLAMSKIARVVPNKKTALTGATLVALGGLVPFFLHSNLIFMLVCSGVLGVGVGIILNVTQLLFNEFLPPEERQGAIALNTVFVSVGAMFMTMVGGVLASSGWENNYLVYLIAVAVVIVAAVCIPDDSDRLCAASVAEAKSKASGATDRVAPSAYVIGLLGLIFLALYNALMNNMAMYAAASGIATTETVSTVAGMAGTLANLAGLLCGLILPKVMPRIQRYSLVITFAFIGVGLIGFGLSTSLVTYYAFAFIVGASSSLYYSSAPFLISISNPPSVVATAIALYAMGPSLGGFLSPVVLNFLSGLLANGSVQVTLLIAGGIGLLVMVILVVTRFQAKVVDGALPQQG